MSDEEEKTPIAEVKKALAALRSDEEPDLSAVLLLVGAGFDHDRLFVPEPVREAVVAKWETDRDLANGGMDQFVWNHGVEIARWAAKSFRDVGAIENADLIDRLASRLESYNQGVFPDEISKDTVRHFLAYRKQVDGPFFDCPEPAEEVGEALIEYVAANREGFPDPDDLPDDQ